MNPNENEHRGPTGRTNLPSARRSFPAWAVWVPIVIVALAAGAWWTHRERPAPTAEQQEVARSPEPAAPAAPAPLPAVEKADALMRKLLAAISPSEEVRSWLELDDLARRLVAAITAIADGQSPRTSVPFLAPKGAFEVAQRDGATVIDARSFARYDRIVAAFGSIDAGACGEAYPHLKTLLEAAYYEIGAPGTTFEGTLTQAIGRLVGTPIPEGDIEVVEAKLAYQFKDPELEKLSAAQKHLLRMGPANMRTTQGKLRDLATALKLDLMADASPARK